MMMPPNVSMVAITGMTSVGFSSTALMYLIAYTPMTAAGRNATMTDSVNMRALASRGRPITTSRNLRQ